MVIAVVVLISVLATYVHAFWVERRKPSKVKRLVVGWILGFFIFALVVIANILVR